MAVGKRVHGLHLARERWFECDVSGLPYVESDTTIPEAPHPQQGLRVSFDFLDEPTDRDTMRQMRGAPETGRDNEGNDD